MILNLFSWEVYQLNKTILNFQNIYLIRKDGNSENFYGKQLLFKTAYSEIYYLGQYYDTRCVNPRIKKTKKSNNNIFALDIFY